MTISNTNRKDVHVTNGTCIYWPYTFQLTTTDGADLFLYETEIASGEITKITDNFTKDLTNTRIIYPTAGTPRPTGYKITVARETPKTQGTSLATQSFDPKNMERGLDKLTAMVQEMDETVSRAAVASISEEGNNFSFPAPVAGDVIGWNAEGTALINLKNTTLGIEAEMLASTAATEAATLAIEVAVDTIEAAVAAAATVPGIFTNFKAVNGASPDTQITITANAGTLWSATNQPFTVSDISLTITSTASGINGLSVGTLAGSTWYYIWIGYNPTTSTIGAWLDPSDSAPTVPSGYTYYARTPSTWLTDGTANKYLMRLETLGSRTQYVITAGTNTANMPLVASGVLGNVSTPIYVATDIGAFVPPTASVIRLVPATFAAGVLSVAPNNGYGAYNSTTNPPPIMTGQSTTFGTSELMLESSNIYCASSIAQAYLRCLGWTDILGMS